MRPFWYKNFARIPHIRGSFIEDFASANLPIKGTQAIGYTFFHEGVVSSNIHTSPTEGLGISKGEGGLIVENFQRGVGLVELHNLSEFLNEK